MRENKHIDVQHLAGKINSADMFSKEDKDASHFKQLRDLTVFTPFTEQSEQTLSTTSQRSRKLNSLNTLTISQQEKILFSQETTQLPIILCRMFSH